MPRSRRSATQKKERRVIVTRHRTVSKRTPTRGPTRTSSKDAPQTDRAPHAGITTVAMSHLAVAEKDDRAEAIVGHADVRARLVVHRRRVASDGHERRRSEGEERQHGHNSRISTKSSIQMQTMEGEPAVCVRRRSTSRRAPEGSCVPLLSGALFLQSLARAVRNRPTPPRIHQWTKCGHYYFSFSRTPTTSPRRGISRHRYPCPSKRR